MIVVMRPNAATESIDRVQERLEKYGYRVFKSGEHQVVLGAVGVPKTDVDPRDVELLTDVRTVIRVARPFKLVNRAFCPDGTVVDVAGVRIGGDEVVVIAGPCAVENRDQIRAGAAAVRAEGAKILRGGAFKPRSSPYSFQGLGEEGLQLLREAADEQGMPCVTEVVDTGDVELVEQYADMLQVGARNMQNFRLLAKVGESSKPVLLKRGLSATLEEFLMAAEYIASFGNPRVVLCERGVRTFEPWTRNTLDLSAIPVLRKATHLPIIIDPSHATGIRDHVMPMSRAAVAAGADGIMVEVHPNPDVALCDGAQSLTPPGFVELMSDLRIIAPAVRRQLKRPSQPHIKRQGKAIFDRAAVIGSGLIGGSMALALRATGVAAQCVGVDKEDRLHAVRASGVVDEVFPERRMAEALADADLVILATPVRSILKLLGDIGQYLKAEAIVTDVGGTKEAICEAAKALPSGVSFIGGHPMAGSERNGPSAAQPMLFLDAVWAVCPLDTVADDHLNRLKEAILQIGAHPLLIDAARHDRIAAAVSHVPYLVATSLSNSVGRLGEEDKLALRLAGRGFRDVTRIASSPYRLWGDVLSTNQKAVTERLAAFRQAVDRVGEALGSDEQALQAELEDAARYCLNVPRTLPGIQNPDCEIVVRVEDEVGALAAVTTALAQERINVRDIQVLKVRQDTDGVLRLAFGDREETLHAAEVLRRAGHNVRLRIE